MAKFKSFLLLFALPFLSSAQIDFKNYFHEKSLRFDFLLGGNAKEEKVFFQQMKKEPFWGGSKTNLIDPFNYGNFRFRVFDLESGTLIFSKGFSTLFDEWQTTTEAKETERTYYQSAIFPFPRNKVKLEMDARQWDGSFKNIFKTEIDPKSYFILDEKPVEFPIFDILNNGDPAKKVDIVILAEGYTQSEKEKFRKDAEKVSGFLFNEEPFKSEKTNFNIRAVFTPSAESGTDIPGDHIYQNTCFNSTFYTFDISRYLTTSDMRPILDAAATVPYDQIYVLVNTERYGGGGFYNFLTVCTADNNLTPEVFVHEFGHGFAGLADEYYNSEVAYEDFYNLKVEPWEPNITTLVDFDKKWKDLVDKNTEIPTPRSTKFDNTVGVFEGGGYMSKGIFSPVMDCRMKSNQAKGLCPVCQESIKKVIRFYCE